MLVHILKGKGIHTAFFCIETDRDSLHCPDIIHCTDFIKICQRDMPAVLIDFHRRDRCRYLLHNASPSSPYRSFVWLMNSSRVDPLKPLELQVAISHHPFIPADLLEDQRQGRGNLFPRKMGQRAGAAGNAQSGRMKELTGKPVFSFQPLIKSSVPRTYNLRRWDVPQPRDARGSDGSSR